MSKNGTYVRTEIIGRFGQDPETRDGKKGPFTTFTLATEEEEGQTLWWDCAAFGGAGKFVAEFLKKGSYVRVVAQQTERRFTDKNGVEQRRPRMTVKEIVTLSGGKSKEGSSESEGFNVF